MSSFACSFEWFVSFVYISNFLLFQRHRHNSKFIPAELTVFGSFCLYLSLSIHDNYVHIEIYLSTTHYPLRYVHRPVTITKNPPLFIQINHIFHLNTFPQCVYNCI